MCKQLFGRGHAGAFVGLRPDQPRDLLEFARFTEMARGTYPHDEFNDKKQKLVEGFEAAAKVCPPARPVQSDSRAFCQQSYVNIMQTESTLFTTGGPKKAKKTTAKASARL